MPRKRTDLILSDVERRVALREIVGFETLSEEALGAIARLSWRRQLAPGTTTILDTGEARTSMHLLSGDLQLLRMGRPYPFLHERRVLDVFWLARDSMPLEARTESGAVVLEFPLDGLEEVFEEHFSVWLASTQTLAAWLLDARPAAAEGNLERRGTGNLKRLTERVTALEDALPFARGHVDALMQLDEEAVEVRFERGEVLWQPGDDSLDIFVPLDGAVAGVASEEPAGIGSLALLAGRTRTAPGEVLRPLTALRIGRESLLDLLEDHHELARDLVAMIAATVVQTLDGA